MNTETGWIAPMQIRASARLTKYQSLVVQQHTHRTRSGGRRFVRLGAIHSVSVFGYPRERVCRGSLGLGQR
jgi:hypothetical protein